jgi:hypothetical protein
LNKRNIYFQNSHNTWDKNYWDNYDDSGPMVIPRSLQSEGLINQFFHYVLPWMSFDLHPLKEPYEFG